MRHSLLLSLVLSFLCSLASAAEPLRVMSYNIRYNNRGDGENAWPHRKDWVGDIIKREKPDILGLQEAVKLQVTDLEERLPDYAWFGAGRDDGEQKGEFVPIFYRKERFEVLDKGHFWLSETPDKPGSKSWDTSITRMVTWLKLKDKASGQELLALNTHFDHLGKQARVESAKLVLSKLPAMAGDLPVVLTGDFNTGPHSEPYNVLIGKNSAATWLLVDSLTSCQTKPTGPDGTFNNFQKIVPGGMIDFIFTRGLTSQKHAVLDDQKEGKFPSDHCPVVADLELPTK